tara:strand:- start:29675 stop:30742 length:1068 start_codon:yes stop_codon:yes gene_type:complete
MISKNRFLSPKKWDLQIKGLSFRLPTTIIGHSVLNLPIYAHHIGKGSIKVLLWSQMHGNESTTTRALLDLFIYLNTLDGSKLMDGLSLMIIPQLNPDGASNYTRLNANEVDLNRDVIDLSQPESMALVKVFNSFSPDYCFNLHGQRTIFAAGKMGKPATLSFLSPATDSSKTITSARNQAMQLIALLNEKLQNQIPNQIGRYDDTYNPNCVGDHFTSLGIPTLLIEAGHNNLDYDRNFTKKMIFNALLIALNAIKNGDFLRYSPSAYQQIPENEKDYVDLIIKNIDIRTESGFFKNQELALLYKEEKIDESVLFSPFCHSFSNKINFLSHKVLDAREILKTYEIKFVRGKTIDIF